MAFEIRPYPEWSWSQSRDGIFQECKRKYYFYYYASHNGWLRDADELRRIAYRFKQISNLYLVLGDGVHRMAEYALKKWRLEQALPQQAEILANIKQMLNQAYKDSKNKELWMQQPKKKTMLHEMYYGGELPGRRVEQIKERLDACVERFFQSASMIELCADGGSRIVEVEELNTFEIADGKVYVKLDLLYQKADGTWVIVDWKTGLESEKNEKQLLLYALFLHDKYAADYKQMEIRVEYLLSGETVTVAPDPGELGEVCVEVERSMREMKRYLADEGANIPLPMEDFPSNPTRRTCTGCSFLEICGEKWQEA